MNLLTYFNSVLILFKEIYIQRKYNKKYIEPYLLNLEQKYGGTISSHQKIKILNSYCLLVPSVLGVSFRKLYGQKFSEKDRSSSTMTALITPLFDDLIDVEKMEPQTIKKLVFEAEYTGNTFVTKSFKEIGNLLINTAVNKTEFINILEACFESQFQTIQQFNPLISNDDIERITYFKASMAFLFYHVHMIGDPDSEMKNLIYEVSGLQQICNDIFDIYKDCQDKIYTQPNTCKDFVLFKIAFLEKVKKQNQKIMALPFEKKNKEYFCIVMNLIEARALVAINYLIQLENKKGKNIDLFQEERKELVIDMETPRNIIKWFFYSWKLCNTL